MTKYEFIRYLINFQTLRRYLKEILRNIKKNYNQYILCFFETGHFYIYSVKINNVKSGRISDITKKHYENGRKGKISVFDSHSKILFLSHLFPCSS